MRSLSFAPLIALVLLAGCVVPAAQTAYPPVPAPMTEAVPQPPVSPEPMAWQPGHWDWTGSGYAWTAGAWIPRASAGANWMDGYWASGANGWAWVPGHWS